ncbi:MAG: tRNA threonylcarbamoyladenosine dehydratase [Anaerovoracaceae bacterium]
MKIIHTRTARLIGEENIDILKNTKVIVFGVGGVGGYVVEALARAGIGEIDLVDGDTVDETNINRQIIATKNTIGKSKTLAFKERISDIDESIKVECKDMFFLPENSDEIDFTKYDYVVDAVDTVTAKLEIIAKAKAANVMVISSMGTGNKMNPLMLQVDDISKTKICPLAKVMRKELKKRDIKNVKVVYSTEDPVKNISPPGSISFVPSVGGLIIASEVVKDVIKWGEEH